MSDVIVTVVESNTNVTVTEQDVAVAITESPVTVTTSTAGIQGATGATGVGYSGVTSTSTITIGSGLKTFTLVSGNQGAFVTGMRIRAIHSDTPTYYMEGTANYIGGGSLIITVDKFNGSGSHNLWQFAIAGEVGQTGATGSSGVVSVTSPITNTGTSGSAIVGIDQTLLSLTRSQISDFTSGTVTSISGTVTQSQVTSLVTDLSGKASLGAANAFTVGGHVITNAATAVIPLTITGVANQSANLFSVRSSAAELAFISAGGNINAFQQVRVGGSSGLGQLSVTSGAAATIGAVIRGAASQSANLLELQTSDGVLQTAFSPIGYAQIGAGTNPGGQLGIPLGAAANRGIVIRAAASQSADLQQWQTSAGSTAASISSAGQFNSTVGIIGGGAAQATGANNTLYSTGSAISPLVIRGAASQTADLTLWQTNAAGTLARVDSGGIAYFTTVTTLNSYASLAEENSGGRIRLTKMTSAVTNPGASLAKIYLRDGTTVGTLKLVVRAGAAGAETTILDNIPQ